MAADIHETLLPLTQPPLRLHAQCTGAQTLRNVLAILIVMQSVTPRQPDRRREASVALPLQPMTGAKGPGRVLFVNGLRNLQWVPSLCLVSSFLGEASAPGAAGQREVSEAVAPRDDEVPA